MDRLTTYDADGYAYVKGGKVTNKKVAEAILRLAAYEDTGLDPDEIPHWIPCSERLPEEAYGCLLIVEEDDYFNEPQKVLLPYFAGYDGTQWNDGDGQQIPFEVIYWQPLPQPPKEEK